MPSSTEANTELWRWLLKVIAAAVITAVVTQIILYLIHSNADPAAVMPAAGATGFTIVGWKEVSPLLALLLLCLLVLYVAVAILAVFCCLLLILL